MQECKKIKKIGFTLIEMLVVLAILGVLSVIVLVSLNQARAKARDTRRLADMKTIQTMLQIYIINNDDLPSYWSGRFELDGCWDTGGWWDSSNVDSDGDGNAFIDFLAEDGYIYKVPVDPLNDGNGCGAGSHNYVFFVKEAGYWGCPVERGNFFLLGVKDMETSNGIHPASPRFQCGFMDWDQKFEYFTGGFVK